ncbi:transcriptional regulator [Methylobacterium sp. NPDC097178]|uniref:transcriptional regulator n=2 Tax=cellular organisms TaxID=131567 RepID=UPI00383BAF5C
MIAAMSEAALKIAIEKAGGHAKLGRALGISGAAISQWSQCPPLRVLAVEAASGVSRHELRPDLYPVPQPERAA